MTDLHIQQMHELSLRGRTQSRCILCRPCNRNYLLSQILKVAMMFTLEKTRTNERQYVADDSKSSFVIWNLERHSYTKEFYELILFS